MNYQWPLMQNIITDSDKQAMINFIKETDRFTNGPKVKELESKWNEWLGSKHSLFVSSGSTANLLLISALKELYNLKNGDKVLVPACTWVTNISPVFQCGLTPIFCDINLGNYSFDINHAKLIAKNHPDIKVIFFTHLLGFSADVENLQAIFPDAICIEDVCESHGCKSSNGNKRGSQTIGSTFSFYFGHHMTTIEGGMVSTDNSDLYNLMKIKRSHGLARELPAELYEQAKLTYANIDPNFLFLTDGYNFRNNEIAAILGLSQLEKLDQNINIRKNNFKQFMEIITAYGNYFHLPNKDEDTNSNYAFPLILKNHKDFLKLKEQFISEKVEYRPIVGGNLLLQPFLKNYKLEPNSDLNVQTLHDNGIYVGNNQYVGSKELSLLSNILKDIFK